MRKNLYGYDRFFCLSGVIVLFMKKIRYIFEHKRVSINKGFDENVFQ